MHARRLMEYSACAARRATYDVDIYTCAMMALKCRYCLLIDDVDFAYASHALLSCFSLRRCLSRYYADIPIPLYEAQAHYAPVIAYDAAVESARRAYA